MTVETNLKIEPEGSEPPALGWLLYLAGFGAFLILPRLFLPLVTFLIFVGSAIWVFFDAQQIHKQTGRVVGGNSSTVWSVATLLLWLFLLPVYLLARRRHFRPAPKRRAGPVPGVVWLIVFALLVLVVAMIWRLSTDQTRGVTSRGLGGSERSPAQVAARPEDQPAYVSPETQVARALERSRSEQTQAPADVRKPRAAPQPRRPPPQPVGEQSRAKPEDRPQTFRVGIRPEAVAAARRAASKVRQTQKPSITVIDGHWHVSGRLFNGSFGREESGQINVILQRGGNLLAEQAVFVGPIPPVSIKSYVVVFTVPPDGAPETVTAAATWIPWTD